DGLRRRPALVDADDVAREVDQGRGQGSVPCPVRDLPAGGGGGAASAVRGDAEADRAAAAGGCLGLRAAAADSPGRTSSADVWGVPNGRFWGRSGGERAGCGQFRNQPNTAREPTRHGGKNSFTAYVFGSLFLLFGLLLAGAMVVSWPWKRVRWVRV